MRQRSTRYRARGALQEIPVAAAIVLVVVGALMGHVGINGKKLLAAVDGLVLLAVFYYFILAPGWRPGSTAAPRLMLRRMLFGLLAVLVVSGVVLFALLYGVH
jgi:hypothetical protein